MARVSVDAQLAKIRKARAELEKREKALLNRTQGKVIAKIVQLAVDNGISAAQIAEALKAGKPEKTRRAPKKAAGTRGKVAPKYRNPANAEQTWTGRGKAPLWVQELKNAGTLDAALIKPAGTPA
ncbi:MAG: H-NS histone family protein [Pseudomonadota bacterium]